MQRVEEQREDLIAKVTCAKEAYLLHIEIQNDNQASMPWRMFRYRTDIYFAYPKLAVQQYLFYMGKPPLTIPADIKESSLNFCYQIVNMHEID